jgi:hypothetical protein
MARTAEIPRWGVWLMFLASVVGTYLLGRQLLGG